MPTPCNIGKNNERILKKKQILNTTVSKYEGLRKKGCEWQLYEIKIWTTYLG